MEEGFFHDDRYELPIEEPPPPPGLEVIGSSFSLRKGSLSWLQHS